VPQQSFAGPYWLQACHRKCEGYHLRAWVKDACGMNTQWLGACVNCCTLTSIKRQGMGVYNYMCTSNTQFCLQESLSLATRCCKALSACTHWQQTTCLVSNTLLFHFVALCCQCHQVASHSSQVLSGSLPALFGAGASSHRIRHIFTLQFAICKGLRNFYCLARLAEVAAAMAHQPWL